MSFNNDYSTYQKRIVPITSDYFTEVKSSIVPTIQEKDQDEKKQQTKKIQKAYTEKPIFSASNVGLGLALCGIVSCSTSVMSGSLLMISGMLTYGISELR